MTAWHSLLGPALVAAVLGPGAAALAGAAAVGDVMPSRESAAWRVDAWLPGRISGAVVLPDERGTALWLFVPSTATSAGEAIAAPPGESCGDPPTAQHGQLWRFDPLARGGPTLERVLVGLPSLPAAVRALDLGGAGAPELIALSRGGLYRYPTTPGGAAEALFEDAALDPRTSFLTEFEEQAAPLLAVTDLGRARFLRYEAGRWEPVAEVELPVQAVYRRNEFRLGTRPLMPVGMYGGDPAYADHPEAVDKQRLRGRLVRPTRAEETSIPWWARLPGQEEPIETRYLEIEGEPALFVTTRPANKLSLFGEKRLRLYRLAADRSQTGHPPFFAIETRANLWQSIVPYLRDVDGDGFDDLVLAYWKGLTDSRIVLDAYRSDGAGSFRANPSSTGFDVKKGERSFVAWDHDVTGDGVIDLLVIGRGRLQVHAGDPAARKGRDLVDARSAHEIVLLENAKGDEEVEVDVELDGASMQFEGERLDSRGARLVDLDGDGVHEALFSIAEGELWKVSFVSFTRPSN